MIKWEVRHINGNVISYLQYLTESFQSLAAEKSIQLTFYPEIDHLDMDYDEDKMQTILYNLLSNAIKFTAVGGKVIVHVDSKTEANAAVLMIKIKDTGIGIEEKNLDRVFDRFYQVEDEDMMTGPGTGVGLSLTKDLIELLEGLDCSAEF